MERKTGDRKRQWGKRQPADSHIHRLTVSQQVVEDGDCKAGSKSQSMEHRPQVVVTRQTAVSKRHREKADNSQQKAKEKRQEAGRERRRVKGR